MKEIILLEKSLAFAIRVVNAAKYLMDEKKEFTLSKLFLISGTSIGAYGEEAMGGGSRPDFYSKLALAYKEAGRTNF
jgi:four helix bundle protein